ncbi:uncharacterized protein LOC106130088 [Amyelois transitella]|uniref:uncharacterized protein LOC106130088 n=1 Tax=Amyelois transitella TaxID=680683 RepID=UPI00067C636E|nr:uncharacterized protein LOC106130088 [Amyelois transitella]
MPRCKENFNNKFRLLCSQENCEDINWSSSDSSEYENVSSKLTSSFQQQNRKRKRRKKVPKNISNLDISIFNVPSGAKEIRTEKRQETSPILCSQRYPTYKGNSVDKSPIIHSSKMCEGISKSPILILKSASPTYSTRVKKKLFTNFENETNISKSVSLALNCSDKSKFDDIFLKSHSVGFNNKENVQIKSKDSFHNIDTEVSRTRPILDKENTSAVNLDDSLDSLKSVKDCKLVNKVKSYFDNHFSSESTSQVSIQDSLTPKNNSKTSEEIEIINIATPVNSNKTTTESTKEEPDILCPNKSKKIRYKKDGLAHRLNVLLKKNNANISLWQHERFLATNSNFRIPRGSHLVFIIGNIEIKYGCSLLQARNIENEGFLILINNEYVNNCNISKDVILKVYEPFQIVEFKKDLKLLINVCKFECEKLHYL